MTATLPNTYIVGQTIFLEDVIDTGEPLYTPIDGASDVLTIHQPDGTTATPDVTPGASGTGTYTAQFTPTQSGQHEWVWQSSGGGEGRSRGWFYVSPVP